MKYTLAKDKLLTKAINSSLTTLFATDDRQRIMLSIQNHLQQVKPLIISAHAPIMEGDLLLFSLHKHTVNLINHQQKLITLHRYGSGLSPMGWVLKTYDFDSIKSMLVNNQLTIRQYTNGNLQIGNVLLSHHTHFCNMTLKCKAQTMMDKTAIAQLFKQMNNLTGLFGSLRQNIVDKPVPELITFCDQIDNLMNGKRTVITQFIGFGPGLTPSFDDIMVGILAVLANDYRFAPKMQQLKKAMLALPLDALTTTISATFLKYALQGQFSLPILQVITMLNQHKYHHNAIYNLLNYGHTSGADLLLGIWLAITRFVIKD